MSTTASSSRGAEVRTIAAVGIAHATSHFFQLVLPPLFPFLIAEFDVSYTQLGLLITIFWLTSGIGQPVAGFLVDRFGARTMLLTGLGLYVAATYSMSMATSFWMLYPCVAVAAVGNCVFHPADFTILNASVRASHIGRAFSVHTLGGNLGWALAPGFVLVAAGVAGWRGALAAAAVLGSAVWVMVWLNRAALHDGVHGTGAARPHHPLDVRVLFTPSVVLCFCYFLLLAAALIAVQNFLVPVLGALHGTPLAVAGTALTGFLLGSSAGVIVGGIVADRSAQHAGVIAAGLAGSATAFAVVSQVPLGAAALVLCTAVAGFLSGLTTPSRDMLVRSATPKGATGRVFGFVYSGLDAGGALAPVTVGILLDHGQPHLALWAVSGLLLGCILTTLTLRGTIPAPAPATAS